MHRLRAASGSLEKKASTSQREAEELRERYAEMSRQYQLSIGKQESMRRDAAALTVERTKLMLVRVCVLFVCVSTHDNDNY